jgi:membrane protein YdbS with pleckstrin-like domain
MTGSADGLFAPPAASWQRVSPALARLRRSVLLVAVGVLAVAVVVLEVLLDLPTWLLAVSGVLVVGVAGFAWWLIGRNAQRWGYAESDEELYVTRGALFRRLVVVPYGRMQYVDVQAGPLDRAYGLARIQLHTAAPGTSAHIPGLPAAEAARLRDRLTAQGEAQAAGL